MRTAALLCRVSIVGVIVGTSAVAVGETKVGDTGPPLVVVVDAGPGAGADAKQVREVIGRELGRRIVAFVDGDGMAAPPAGTDEPDLLLVGLSRERIVMSLRRRLEAGIARSVPAPADAAARLRTIAWLAGNVVRDQLSPFLRASADLGVSQTAAKPEPAPEPPVVPVTEPPPVAPPPLLPVETLTATAAAPPVPTPAPWSVTIAGGPVFESRGAAFSFQGPPVSFQIELARHRPDGWIVGAALDGGVAGMRYGGLSGVAGFAHRWSKLHLEATLGIGLEIAPVRHVTWTYSSSGTGDFTSETTVSSQTAVLFYNRAFVTLSRELTPSWELLFRLGAQLPFGETLAGPLVLGSAGMRFNLL
jgi:hypothetical protein